jgi:hypothetical protein
LPDLGILAPASCGLGDTLRPLGLGLGYGLDDFLGGRFVRFTGTEEELEEDGTLELGHGIGDLVPGACRRVPLGDDAFRVRDADPQRGRPDLSFPDDLFAFHYLTPIDVPRVTKAGITWRLP